MVKCTHFKKGQWIINCGGKGSKITRFASTRSKAISLAKGLINDRKAIVCPVLHQTDRCFR